MAKSYTGEFRRDAVRLATTSGLTRPQLSSDLGVGLSAGQLTTLNVGFQKGEHKMRTRSEGPVSADSVEKQRAASAEIGVLICARVPFLSGFSRLLRCRKDLGQFSEVLGGSGEEEFVICAARPA